MPIPDFTAPTFVFQPLDERRNYPVTVYLPEAILEPNRPGPEDMASAKAWLAWLQRLVEKHGAMTLQLTPVVDEAPAEENPA